MQNQFRSLLFLLLISTIFCVNTLYGQAYNSTNGARANGMAGAVVNLRDVWAIQNNVAGIARLQLMETSMYFQNRFGISGLNYVSVASVKPLKAGAIGLSIDRFGNQNLNEQRLGVGYAHNIDNVSLGLKVNVLQVSIKDVGTRSVIALEFGGIARLNKELVFGAHIYNFNKAKAGKYMDERFSTVMKAGISYQPFEKLILIVESEKNIEYDADIKLGMEYQIIKKIYFRSGISMLTSSGAIGFGLKTNKIKFDYALNSHSQLGISNHISINYLIGSPKSSVEE